jgi:hypothetical protein
MVAVKVLAWLAADGYPTLAPALSLQPQGTTRLTCCPDARLPRPSPGATVAANILTFEAVSYQVKGTWSGGARTGSILVKEAYAGGPPYPGGRVA